MWATATTVIVVLAGLSTLGYALERGNDARICKRRRTQNIIGIVGMVVGTGVWVIFQQACRPYPVLSFP